MNERFPVKKLTKTSKLMVVVFCYCREDLNNIDGGFWAFKIPNDAAVSSYHRFL